MRAQVVLFDGFDPLDAIGPYETLTAGGFHVELVTAEGPREVPAGLNLMTLKATAKLDRADIVVVPGAAALAEDEITALLAKAAQTLAEPLKQALQDATVATVCGGSLLLGIAGLLNGRNATTNHLGLKALKPMCAQAIRARIVDDGNLVTAAGITSGVDLALYLVERFGNPQRAVEVEELFAHERRGTVWRAA